MVFGKSNRNRRAAKSFRCCAQRTEKQHYKTERFQNIVDICHAAKPAGVVAGIASANGVY